MNIFGEKYLKSPLLDNESSSVGAVDDEMQTSEVRTDTGISELIAIIYSSDCSPAKTLSLLQPASLQAGGNVEVCFSVPAASLHLPKYTVCCQVGLREKSRQSMPT